MNSRFRKLAVESLEGRSVLSTMIEADFNGDGHLDVAAITAANTIEVSLFDPASGGYDVSATLTAPKGQTILYFPFVNDRDGDGDMDLLAIVSTRKGAVGPAEWQNNGDGTFSYIEYVKWPGPKSHGGW